MFGVDEQPEVENPPHSSLRNWWMFGRFPKPRVWSELNNILGPELGEFEFGRCPQSRVWVIWENSLKVNDFEGTRVCGELHQLEFGGSLKQRERKIEMNSE